MAYNQQSGLLAVGGGGAAPSAQAQLVLLKAPGDDEPPTPLAGLSVWHLTDSAPHATLLFTTTSIAASQAASSQARLVPEPARRLFRRLKARLSGDGVPHSVAFSHGGERLAVLTLVGELSVWGTASLKQAANAARAGPPPGAEGPATPTVAPASAGAAPAASAPVPATMGAAIPDFPLVRTNGVAGSSDQWISASWWDERSLILGCRSGEVFICALPELHNLLGTQPERFASWPVLSNAQAGAHASSRRFFILEREVNVVGKPLAPLGVDASAAPPGSLLRLRRSPSGGGGVSSGLGATTSGDGSGGGADDSASASTLDVSLCRLQSWRLLSLRQTSPEQLFLRKVALKEYGDALLWAQRYGMSTDPVRQAQWAASEVSRHSISDYLDKVSCKRWVLDECCRRVPDDAEMVEILLEFGAKVCERCLRVLTDDEVAVGAAVADGTCRTPPRGTAAALAAMGDFATGEGAGDGADSPAASPRAAATVPPSASAELTLAELHRYRRRLRRYQARLKTSLQLAEANRADGGAGNFDPEAYTSFRDAGVFDVAVEMAELESFSALSVLFDAHRAELGPRRLSVLRMVPETTPPATYHALVEEVVRPVLEAEAGRADDEDDEDDDGEAESTGSDEEAEHAEGGEDAEASDGSEGSSEENDDEGGEASELEQAQKAAKAGGAEAGEATARAIEAPTHDDREGSHGEGLGVPRPGSLALESPTHDSALPPLDRGAIVAWFGSRAVEIDERSGQLHHALGLLDIAMQLELETELTPLHRHLQQLMLLVYDLGCSTSLAQFESLAPAARLQLLLDQCTGDVHPHPDKSCPDSKGSTADIVHGVGAAVGAMAGAVLSTPSLLSSGASGGAARAGQEALEQRFEEFSRVHLRPFLMLEPHGPALLREYMFGLASRADDPTALPRVVSLIRSSRAALHADERLLKPMPLLIDTALRCIYASPRRDEETLELMTMMYKALPSREQVLAEATGAQGQDPPAVAAGAGSAGEEDPAELLGSDDTSAAATATGVRDDGAEGTGPLPPPPGADAIERLLDELDELYSHLKAQHNLREYGCIQPMGAYREAAGGHGLTAARGRTLLRTMARQPAQRSPPATSVQWAQTRDDMVSLREHACVELPAQLPYCEWMQSLLLAGQYRLAGDYLRSYTIQEQIDTATAESLVLEAARELLNAASSTIDPALDHVAECIRVLPGRPSEAVQTELALLEAMRVLASYGSTPPPLMVRRHPKRIEIVLELLESEANKSVRMDAASAIAVRGTGDAAVRKDGGSDGGHAVATDYRHEGSDEALGEAGDGWGDLGDLELPDTPAEPGGPELPQLESLVRLATLLGVAEDEARAALAERMATLALQQGKRSHALELTIGLVEADHPPAWQLCEALCAPAADRDGAGAEEVGHDLCGRLLSHALMHCPEDRFDRNMALWREWRTRDKERQLRELEAAAAKGAANEVAVAAARAAMRQQRQAERFVASWKAQMQSKTEEGATGAIGDEVKVRSEPPSASEPGVLDVVPGDDDAVDEDAQVADLEALLLGTIARGDHVLAAALIWDRPSLAKLAAAASTLQTVMAKAALSGDADGVLRAASIGMHGFGLLAAVLTGVSPEDAMRASTREELMAPSAALEGAAGAALAEKAATEAGKAVEAPHWVELLAAAVGHLVRCENVLQRMEEAERLQAWLPDIHAASYATDDTARSECVRRLAASPSEAAFDEALALAPSTGLDKWELHMACVHSALTCAGPEHGGVAASTVAGSPESASAAVRAAVARHGVALLAQSDRMTRSLALRTLPSVPTGGDWLLQLLELLQAAAAQQCAVTTADSAASDAGHLPCRQAAHQHNAELLDAVVIALRALGRVAPAADLRHFLSFECEHDEHGHARLTVCAAPTTREAWRASVGTSGPSRLVLVAPLLATCVRVSAAAESADAPQVPVSCRPSDPNALFTPSAVWVAQLEHMLMRQGAETADATAPAVESDALLSACGPLLRRISSADLGPLLVRLVPQLHSPPDGAVAVAADCFANVPVNNTTHSLRIPVPLDPLCKLIALARRLLCARCLCSLALSALKDAHAAQAASVLGVWRMVAVRSRHLEAVAWLRSMSLPVDLSGEAEMAASGRAAYTELLPVWVRASGCATSEREALIWMACRGQAEASARAAALEGMLAHWHAELHYRAARAVDIPHGESDEGSDGPPCGQVSMHMAVDPGLMACAASLGELTEQAARRLAALLASTGPALPSLPSLVEWRGMAPGRATEGFEDLSRLLQLCAVATLPVPRTLVAFSRDEAQPEGARLVALQLIHQAIASGAAIGGDTSAAGEATPDDEVELMLRLHACSILRAAWANTDPASLETAIASLSAPGALATEGGMRATASSLLELIGAGVEAVAAVAGDEHRTPGSHDGALCRLLAIATLLATWRPHLERLSAPSSDEGPYFHAECSELLRLGLRHHGAAALVKLRQALPSAPHLIIGEEYQLAAAVRQMLGEGGQPDEAERTCVVAALLSGHAILEQEALRGLAIGGRRAPLPDAPLLELLISRGDLTRLARTAYWPHVLGLLRDVQGEELPIMVIAALGKAQLYTHAGSVVLHRSHCHPALQSAAAAHAVLRAYVRWACNACADDGKLEALNAALANTSPTA